MSSPYPKRRIIILTVILSLSVLTTTHITIAENDKVVIAASIAPLGAIVKEVGGDCVEVEVLAPEGVELHTWTATPEVIQKAVNASLLVHTGHFLWEETIINQAGKPSIGLENFEEYGAQLSSMPSSSQNEQGEHDNENIHGYWLKPSNALAIANATAHKLTELCPEDEEIFKGGLHSFAQKIDAFNDFIDGLPRSYWFADVKVVLTFPAEAYIAETFGLEVENLLVRGENVFISGQELAELEDKMRSGEIDFILASEITKQMYAGQFAEQLAADTGISLVYVRSASFGNEGWNDYLSFMMYNAGALAGGVMGRMEGTETTSLLETQILFFMIIAVLVATILMETILLIKRKQT